MKIPKLKTGDAIEITWLDSHCDATKRWMTEIEALDQNRIIKIRSICQYLSHDTAYFYTASDRFEDADIEATVSRDLKIPIGCIKSIRRLK